MQDEEKGQVEKEAPKSLAPKVPKPKAKRKRAPNKPKVIVQDSTLKSEVKDDNADVKASIAAMKERKRLLDEAALLKKELESQKAVENQLTGTIMRWKLSFTPAEMKYLANFDATGKKDEKGHMLFYTCKVTENCPNLCLTVCGQAFEREACLRKDGTCPKCSKEAGNEGSETVITSRNASFTPIQAGDFNAKCPKCGSKLVYTSEEYKELTDNQFYCISGDTIFGIAIVSHDKKYRTMVYDKITREEIGHRDFSIVDFIECALIRVNDKRDILEKAVVDFKRIKEHYDSTSHKDESGNILAPGEKKMFFKKPEVLTVNNPDEINPFALAKE